MPITTGTDLPPIIYRVYDATSVSWEDLPSTLAIPPNKYPATLALDVHPWLPRTPTGGNGEAGVEFGEKITRGSAVYIRLVHP